MKCGIIILNYNEYPVTQNLLEHIKDSPDIDNIVIVDNGSTDDSFNQLKKYQNEKISLIQSGRDGGYSYGNNFGARYMIEKFQPDIIGIANPDTIFDDDLVKIIKKSFAANPDYAVLTGIQKDISGRQTQNFSFEESNAYLFLKPLIYEIFLRPFRKIFKSDKYKVRLNEILNNPETLSQVWQVGGSLFFIRTKDFQDVGMLDENVFLYYEEHILAYKLQKLGRKSGILNNVSYIHDHKVNPDKNKQLDSGMRFIKNSTVSRKYFFNNYLTSNKILRGFHNFLLCLRCVKSFAVYSVKKFLLKIRA